MTFLPAQKDSPKRQKSAKEAPNLAKLKTKDVAVYKVQTL